MFNAALILRRAIQSLQPITPFQAEPADLSEEKIDVHVPSELYNSLMDNDWKSSGHGTLSEQESRARQLFFGHACFFSMCCSISFLLFALLNSANHVDIIFMLFTLQS